LKKLLLPAHEMNLLVMEKPTVLIVKIYMITKEQFRLKEGLLSIN